MGLHAADVLADGKAEHWSGSWQGKSQFDHIVAHLHLLLQLEFQPLLCNKDSCNSHIPKLADIGEGVLVKKLKEYELYKFSQVLWRAHHASHNLSEHAFMRSLKSPLNQPW